MSKNDKLNVSVTILHEMDNVQYKISGNLIGINENSNTCTIRFKNGRVESGIPMSDVYIAEGLLDTVKKYGKKFATWLMKKVKGLVAFCNLDGEMDENCFFSPVNILAKQSNGTLPSACRFYPTQNIIEQAEAAGISVVLPDDNELSQAEKDEIEGIERFWTRVMNVAGTTDKTVEESIKYVNEAYYHNSALYNKLNEVTVYSLKSPKDELGRDDLDGRWVNTTELKEVLKRSIKNQLQLQNKFMPSNFDDDNVDPDLSKWAEDYVEVENKNKKKFPVPMIWGAPGIGKTVIVENIVNSFKDDPDTPMNLYFYPIFCAGLDSDSFRLPAPVDLDGAKGVKDLYFGQGIICWLPMYRPRDAAYNKRMEDRFARCMHISSDRDAPLVDSDNDEYQGGVLFLDEIVRVQPHAFSTIMNICDRGLQEMKLADSWAIICAANRFVEDPTQEAIIDLMKSGPINDRFIPYTYVPEKQEWLMWARDDSKIKGVSNIHPLICDFIAAMPDKIWYKTFDNGGHDEEIKKRMNTNKPNDYYKDGVTYVTIADFMENIDKDEEKLGAFSKERWNSRTWERISNEYANMLKDVLSQNPKNYSYPICLARSVKKYNYGGIDDTVLEEALDYVPEEKWKQWCEQYKQKYKKGLSGFERLDFIRKALIEIVREHCASNDPEPAREMKKYFDWQAIFSDPKIIDSIYNTGLMPKKYQQQDDAGRYVDGGFAWKDNSAIVREVESFLMKQYPNSNAVNDFRDYVEFISPGVNSLVEMFDTIGAKKTTTVVQNKIDAIIKKAFECPIVFNAEKYEEYFTVHTGTKKWGDIRILNIDEISPVVNNIIFNMIEECDFVRYLLNLVKYYIKIDYTIDTFTVIGNYREGSEFKDFVEKILSLSQSVITEYQNVRNKIGNINGSNIVNNSTISALQYLSVFDLMKQCFLTAFSIKKKNRLGGKVSA